jgi:hypothetical protein
METPVVAQPTLRTLPGDDVRQILWRFADRYDLAMLVQAARSVARGPVARLVAEGARNSHEWTEGKARLLTELRRERHDRRLPRSGARRVHRRPEKPGFGPDRLRVVVGGRRGGHLQSGGEPGFGADS